MISKTKYRFLHCCFLCKFWCVFKMQIENWKKCDWRTAAIWVNVIQCIRFVICSVGTRKCNSGDEFFICDCFLMHRRLALGLKMERELLWMRVCTRSMVALIDTGRCTWFMHITHTKIICIQCAVCMLLINHNTNHSVFLFKAFAGRHFSFVVVEELLYYSFVPLYHCITNTLTGGICVYVCVCVHNTCNCFPTEPLHTYIVFEYSTKSFYIEMSF